MKHAPIPCVGEMWRSPNVTREVTAIGTFPEGERVTFIERDLRGYYERWTGVSMDLWLGWVKAGATIERQAGWKPPKGNRDSKFNPLAGGPL